MICKEQRLGLGSAHLLLVLLLSFSSFFHAHQHFRMNSIMSQPCRPYLLSIRFVKGTEAIETASASL